MDIWICSSQKSRLKRARELDLRKRANWFFSFGKKYKWRYCGIKNGKPLSWNGPYYFEIADNEELTLKQFRCRVLKNDTSKNAGGLITIDYGKIAVDRKGNPVWYLPHLRKFPGNPGKSPDIRITNAGTFLFMINGNLFECDINGKKLWSAPNDGKVSGDTTEYYHHDFIRMPDGNYMVLGEKYIWKNIQSGFNKSKFRAENLDTLSTPNRVKILFGTIIEYNSKGEVVWSWNSADYFSDLDIFSNETATNHPRRNLPERAEIFGHMNAFTVDADGKFIYAGFRDISRIVKIEKSSGKVVDSWGKRLPSGDAAAGEGFFKNQHDVCLTPNGNIAVFNNNGLNDSLNTSAAVEFSQSKLNEPSKITWTFDCKFDSLTNGKSNRTGGVEFLNNNNVLICMGTLCRVTEVTHRDKEVVWDAFFETGDASKNLWTPLMLYRAHYSSSLYPCYFTIKSYEDKIRKNDLSVKIMITNEGSNDDSYSINVTDESGINLYSNDKIEVKATQMLNLNFKINALPAKAKKISVVVNSNTNKNLIKKAELEVVK